MAPAPIAAPGYFFGFFSGPKSPCSPARLKECTLRIRKSPPTSYGRTYGTVNFFGWGGSVGGLSVSVLPAYPAPQALPCRVAVPPAYPAYHPACYPAMRVALPVLPHLPVLLVLPSWRAPSPSRRCPCCSLPNPPCR